jgi:type II secretory pathway pseudopilin PulG
MGSRSRLYEWVFGAVLIALLAAVTIPAIQAAREAARQQTCENNLKQLSLGLLNYSDTYGSFPPGTTGNRELPPTERFSWYPTIWVFIEGKPPRLLLDETQAWNAEVNRFPQAEFTIDWAQPTERTEIRPLPPRLMFACPSAKPSAPVFGIPVTQYVGLAGLGLQSPEFDSGQPGAGVWGYDRHTKIDDFADASSATILLLETNYKTGPWLAGGPPTVRGIDPAAAPFFGPGRQFGGLHPTSSSAAMLDGSVRQLSNETDPATLAALATIAAED